MDSEQDWLVRFPKVLRSKRKQGQLTRSELAERIGVSVKAVKRWEAGEEFPTLPEFFRLATVFGWPIPQEVIEGGAG